MASGLGLGMRFWARVMVGAFLLCGLAACVPTLNSDQPILTAANSDPVGQLTGYWVMENVLPDGGRSLGRDVATLAPNSLANAAIFRIDRLEPKWRGGFDKRPGGLADNAYVVTLAALSPIQGAVSVGGLGRDALELRARAGRQALAIQLGLLGQRGVAYGLLVDGGETMTLYPLSGFLLSPQVKQLIGPDSFRVGRGEGGVFLSEEDVRLRGEAILSAITTTGRHPVRGDYGGDLNAPGIDFKRVNLYEARSLASAFEEERRRLSR